MREHRAYGLRKLRLNWKILDERVGTPVLYRLDADHQRQLRAVLLRGPRLSVALSSTAFGACAARPCKRSYSPGPVTLTVKSVCGLQELQHMPDFENVRLEVRDDPGRVNAKIVVFHLYERLVVRRIEYQGLNSVTQSDVLDRFKDRKVKVSVEGLFDPTETDKAEVVIGELLAEHGRHAATVKATYETIPGTNAVRIVFTIDKGPSTSN